jgi:deoxyribodipyrimidine photolyase-like uncharacterized protein
LKGRKLCDGKLLSHARKKHHVLMEGNNPVTGKWNSIRKIVKVT